MANDKVIVDLSVNGSKQIDETTMSLKQLKAELKAAQSAALNGDGQAARRVAELRDRMEDLRDETRALQGSGIERTSTSFSMMGEGLMNLDFDKIKAAFQGLGSAMKAIPIFLIIEGIKYLVENFDSLSKGSGLLAKTLRLIGDALGWIGDKITAVVNFFTDMTGATSDATRALEAQGKAIKQNAEESKAALDSQSAAFDRQIAKAKAAGKSTVELEKAKQQAIIDTNLMIARQIEAYVRAGGELDAEKKKILSASLDFIRNAKNQQEIIEITAEKEKNDKLKEAYKTHLADKEKLDAEARFRKKLLEDQDAADQKYLDDQNKQEQEKFLNNQRITEQAVQDLKYETGKRNEQIEKENAAKELANYKALLAAKQQTLNSSLVAAQGLSDLFFQLQLNGAKGNATKELEIKKKAFEVDKAFNAAKATMDGIRAVQAALTLPPPFGQIEAVIVGVTAAANVAKILATQFNAGSVGAGSSGTIGSIGGGSSGSGNIPAPPTPPQIQASTFLGNPNQPAQQQPVRAYVVETDNRDASSRIDRLSRQATF